ncbi:MAG TPA: IS256 family transposase [Cryptosporangiaceae bacterium]|nr:IS256 family transposase [Cryptosporangiaceae bacterium]
MERVPEGTAATTAAAVVGASLDELAREGARRMLVAALEAEVADYLARFGEARDERGHAEVVRNGHGRPRQVTVGAGTLEVRAPRVDDRRIVDGAKQTFRSRILPPYLRRSPKVAEVLPLLYLHGLSTGDFRPALAGLLGEDAAGLSPTAIARLVKGWEAEYEAFRRRDLADRDYVYVWADGVHFNVRLEDDRLCTLVIIGARPDGTKEVIAVEDGYRESTESWLAVLRDLRRRGMRAPVLAVADRALGFWAAARDVWPETQAETCWVHRIANVLDKLPKRLQPKAKRALHAMLYAESRAACLAEIGAFVAAYAAKYPKAVASLTADQERLLTHFAFPAEHWGHLRTTNPIESTFATVKLRQRVTKGAGSRTAGLTMAFKLLAMAERRWRRLNAPHLVAQVRAGVRFRDGLRIERTDTITDTQTAA